MSPRKGTSIHPQHRTAGRSFEPARQLNRAGAMQRSVVFPKAALRAFGRRAIAASNEASVRVMVEATVLPPAARAVHGLAPHPASGAHAARAGDLTQIALPRTAA